MAIQGLRNTDTFNNPAGRRPQNFREAILMLYPNSGGGSRAPLTALTAVMKSAPTDDPLFHWFTKQMQDRRLKLAATLSATPVAGGADTITVDSTYSSALGLKGGDLLLVEQTNEVLSVSATPTSAGSIGVVRGFTGTPGGALTAVTYNGAGVNPYLKVIGSAFEEGSAAPDPIAFDPVELISQTQIFRGTYALTGTAQQTNTRTGDEMKEARREALEVFSNDMEMAFFFGQKTTTIRNGQPLRTTAGVTSYIPAARRYVPGGGIITMSQLEQWAIDIFRYGSEEKMCFCGSTFLTAISQMVRKSGRAQFEISDKVTEYGIGGITRLSMPNGVLVLKAHPLFTQMTGGTNAGTPFTSMDNAAVVIDMANIRYRYMRNRDVSFQDNLQLPGVDARQAGWLGECGLEVNHPYTHAYIGGVTGGASDVTT